MVNMKSVTKRFVMLLFCLGAGMVLVGCAATSQGHKNAQASGEEKEPFVYHSGNEIPEGPGLFTGESGKWTIYSSDKLPWDSKPADQASPQKSQDAEQKKETAE
jgi:hypothetical protein